MSEERFQKTDLATIAGGVVPELFADQLAKVLKNIDDLNVESKQKRTITIELEFKPDASRQAIEVTAKVKSKLATAKVAEGVMFLVHDGRGEPMGVDSNPRQPELFRG